MAQEEVRLRLDADTAKAQKKVMELTEQLELLRAEQKLQAEESLIQSKKTAKGITGIGKAVQGFGNFLKAAGIGLAIAAFAKFQEILMQNQKAADFFNTAFEVVSIALNDFVSFIVDNTDAVVGFFKGIFDDPMESLKSFAQAFKENIQERFESYLDTLGYLASAVKKVFSGDFKGALEDVKSAGKESLDVLTGVNNSFDKGSEFISKAKDAIVEYGKEAIKTAATNVKLKNTAQLAAAQQSRLIEQYDRQAEQLRQIRDDERFSIEERRKANDQLLQVLAEQEEAMLRQAQAQVASAQADLAKNNSIENQVALTDALANKEGVLAQIEGLRSEQKANDLALDREENELINTKLESESQLAIERERFNAEQIDNEIAKLERLKEIALQEQEQEQARLQAIVDNANAGTQAKVDAQIALDEFMEQSRQANITADKALSDAKIALNKAEAENELELLGAVGGALNGVSALAGENAEAQKAIGVAQAIIDTYIGANKAIAQGGIVGTVAAAGIIATGLANVQNILSTKIPKAEPSSIPGAGAGSISSAGVSAAPQAPQFNILGAGATNQLAGLLAEDSQKPVKAYVVSNEVSSAQSLDRNIVESATLG